jgi:hypothetical protein
MFIVGYKMRYASGVHLNEVSGDPLALAARGAASAARGTEALAARLVEVVGGIAGRRSKERAEGPRRRGRAREHRLEFVVEPLQAPSIVRPEHEPHVLYVRLAAPHGRSIAVLPAPGAAIAAELERARQAGAAVERAVLVGADSIVDPRAPGRAGHDVALAHLVEAIGAFARAGVPFVWRTRGGIDGPIPHALGQALVDAGALALVELGVPTLDHELCVALEGHDSAAPEHRVRLAAALVSRGVHVRGLLDPLVPMLTDQQGSLEALLGALGDAGVSKIGARYIVLTRERARAVAGRLTGMHRALLQGVFADEPWHKPDPQGTEHGAREVHKRIPSHLRRAGHHRLLEAGARHGLFVDILDPVADGEGEDLTAPGVAEDGDKPKEAKARSQKRRRPQLELFRKAR